MLCYLSNVLHSRSCSCANATKTKIYIGGARVHMCEECITYIMDIIISASKTGPHCITWDDRRSNNYECLILSFITGTLMKLDSDRLWKDSCMKYNSILSFSKLVSPCLYLVPFYRYTNPVSASLLNVYLPQAICEPSCRYHSNMVLIPKYQSEMM